MIEDKNKQKLFFKKVDSSNIKTFDEFDTFLSKNNYFRNGTLDEAKMFNLKLNGKFIDTGTGTKPIEYTESEADGVIKFIEAGKEKVKIEKIEVK